MRYRHTTEETVLPLCQISAGPVVAAFEQNQFWMPRSTMAFGHAGSPDSGS